MSIKCWKHALSLIVSNCKFHFVYFGILLSCVPNKLNTFVNKDFFAHSALHFQTVRKIVFFEAKQNGASTICFN